MNASLRPLHIMCAVCSGHAGGHGFCLGRTRVPIWACNMAECIALLPKVYAMSTHELDAYERRAIEEGGGVAGEYLQSIGKFNLAELTPEEWDEFCRRMLHGFQDAMRRLITSHEAPF
jgi:hypothetical protein